MTFSYGKAYVKIYLCQKCKESFTKKENYSIFYCKTNEILITKTNGLWVELKNLALNIKNDQTFLDSKSLC